MENEWNGMDGKKMSNMLSKMGLPVDNERKGKNDITNEERRADAINSIANILGGYYKELFSARQRADTKKIKEITGYINHVKYTLDTRIRGLIYIEDNLEHGKLYGVLRNLMQNKIKELDEKEKKTDLELFVNGSVKLDFEDMIKALDLRKEETRRNEKEVIKEEILRNRKEIHRAGPYRPEGADWQRGDKGGVVYGVPSSYDGNGFHTEKFHKERLNDGDER